MKARVNSLPLRVTGILAGAAILGLELVYGVSEWKLRRTYEAPLLPLRARLAADPVAGEHMAKVVGCWAGSYGKKGEDGADAIARIHRNTAPNLSQVVPLYSDEELARLIPYVWKRDGESAVGMYAATLWPLGDQDLVNIIVHLRRLPILPAVLRRHELVSMTFA